MAEQLQLLRDVWLPVRRRAGLTEHVALPELTSGLESDPVVALATARPDFAGAALEFLIGLFTVAFMPADEAAWRELWKAPPSPSQIAERFAALPNAFALDGAGPRFMQDLNAAELDAEDLEPIQNLLVNAKNSALFVKPEQVIRMSRATAAMALITMQSYSTAGGRGWRTSVRGGGPLTTLVDPRAPGEVEASLFHQIWANVETVDGMRSRHGALPAMNDPALTFPWLAATRTSRSERDVTTPAAAHPLQAYFGMPRRIRLEFDDTPGICDVSGEPDERMAVGYRGKAYGVNYVGWIHPLSPYYAGKQPNELLPLHGQPGGVGWRDWLSLMYGVVPARTPARAVATFSALRAERVGRSSYSVRAFGYDAAQAKIRAWIEARLPAFAEPDEERLLAAADVVRSLSEATEKAAYVVQEAVVRALYKDEDVSGDLSHVKLAVWRVTEPWLYDDELKELLAASDVVARGTDVKARYRPVLARAGVAVFDHFVPLDTTDPDVLKRIIHARYGLVMTLAGGGKMGDQIFALLGVPTAKQKQKRTRSAASAIAKG